MEYSIEAAAFFNPCMMEHPDQSGLLSGEKRVLLSFRATGEGHISSIVFRQAILDEQFKLTIDPPGKLLEVPEHIREHIYDKDIFLRKFREMRGDYEDYCKETYGKLDSMLPDSFSFETLKQVLNELLLSVEQNPESRLMMEEIKWLASSHYNITFSPDTSICERVIFPLHQTEKNGIEDARFVKFTDKNSMSYYATYTAYDGISILPKLLLTEDFRHFKIRPLYGLLAQNKGMALFPRKIRGKYAMLCRSDGKNNYLAYSDRIDVWQEASLIQSPREGWELVQLGNCGSPLETEKGWLVLTHGVGPMREYAIGAMLLDLENPEIEIGRLATPLLFPNSEEREGYVPNVLYSCGSFLHNGKLIIPYAMSDYASTYAVVDLQELLDALSDP